MKTIIPFMCNIMHVDLTDYQLTKEDKERIHLLSIVEKKGLKPLNLENLRLLERLVEKKDYGTSKKAQKAKIKLLNKINVAIYELRLDQNESNLTQCQQCKTGKF